MFKSNEELQRRFEKVVGGDSVSRTASEAVSVKMESPVVSKSSSTEDDEDLDYFKSLIND